MWPEPFTCIRFGRFTYLHIHFHLHSSLYFTYASKLTPELLLLAALSHNTIDTTIILIIYIERQMGSSRHHTIDPTKATPSPAGGIDGAGLDVLDDRQRSKPLSDERIDQEHLYHSKTSGSQAYIDNTHEEEEASSASTSKGHITSKDFDKTRVTDDISTFDRLDEHQDFALIRTTSQHIDPSKPRRRSADATLSRNPLPLDDSELSIIDQYQVSHQLHQHPSLNKLRSISETNLPSSTQRTRLNYIQHWISDADNTGEIQRSLQILEKKIQRFQAAARKKCIAVNPELCKIHGARHRDRNTYLQSMPDINFSQAPLGGDGFGLVDGIFDVKKCGTRLPSEAATVSDVEADVEEGVPARLARRRRRREGFCWGILVSPYWWLLLFLMFVGTGLEINRQLKGEGFT